MDFHIQSRRLVLYGWEKNSLRWVLLTCPWFNSFNCLWTCLVFVFGCFVSFRMFFYLIKKNPKTLKIFQKDKNILFWVLFYFSWGLHELWYLSWFRTCLTLWRNLDSMCYISAKLFLILCEYVLVCTCIQGLIKKLIFLVYVPSIA